MEDFTISCLTWNIELQKFYEKYKESKDIIKWPKRLSVILEFLKNSKADIICLQEVDLEKAKDDFDELFSIYDYTVHEISKKRTNFYGNMILWKKSVFELVSHNFRSYSIDVVLLHKKSNKKLWITNVHLRAGLMSGEKTRVNQLESRLKDKKNKYNNISACICGDFNDNFEEDALFKKVTDYDFKYIKGPMSCLVRGRYFSFDHAITSSDINMKYVNKYKVKEEISDHSPVSFILS